MGLSYPVICEHTPSTRGADTVDSLEAGLRRCPEYLFDTFNSIHRTQPFRPAAALNFHVRSSITETSPTTLIICKNARRW